MTMEILNSPIKHFLVFMYPGASTNTTSIPRIFSTQGVPHSPSIYPKVNLYLSQDVAIKNAMKKNLIFGSFSHAVRYIKIL